MVAIYGWKTDLVTNQYNTAQYIFTNLPMFTNTKYQLQTNAVIFFFCTG